MGWSPPAAATIARQDISTERLATSRCSRCANIRWSSMWRKGGVGGAGEMVSLGDTDERRHCAGADLLGLPVPNAGPAADRELRRTGADGAARRTPQGSSIAGR